MIDKISDDVISLIMWVFTFCYRQFDLRTAQTLPRTEDGFNCQLKKKERGPPKTSSVHSLDESVESTTFCNETFKEVINTPVLRLMTTPISPSLTVVTVYNHTRRASIIKLAKVVSRFNIWGDRSTTQK
jgi:hypothetical protein